MQVRRLHLPLGTVSFQGIARGAARAPPLLLCGGRRNEQPPRRTTRPCGTGPCTTSCMRSPARRPSASALLLESGAEIPFEVAESPGARSVLYRYRPLSDEFVRERFPELRALPAFPEALAALSRIEGVSGYLRVMGTSYVPASERDRAEAALERFLGRVWEESSSFDLEGDRFERAYRELESVIYEDTAVNTVLAPLAGRGPGGGALGPRVGDIAGARRSVPGAARGRVGVRPPGRRAEHARRADRRVAPHAAASPDGGPHGLPQARHGAAPAEAGRRRAVLGGLVAHRRRAVAGGAARHVRPLARWRLSASSRPSAAELVELFELARSRPALGGALPWALARFELGCEQPVALDGLSDHLLALRALLDRGDPSPEGLARRLGALCAEPAHRRAVEELCRAGVQARAAGDARQRRRRVSGDDRRRVARCAWCGARGEPARAAARHGLRPPRAGPGRHRRGAAGACGRSIARSRTPRRPAPPPEADFVVRRRVAPHAARGAHAGAQPVRAHRRAETKEAVAVGGVREVEPESERARLAPRRRRGRLLRRGRDV